MHVRVRRNNVESRSIRPLSLICVRFARKRFNLASQRRAAYQKKKRKIGCAFVLVLNRSESQRCVTGVILSEALVQLAAAAARTKIRVRSGTAI